jgi:hypothetical protein
LRIIGDLARTIAYDYLQEQKSVEDRGAFSAKFCSEFEKQEDRDFGLSIGYAGLTVGLNRTEADYLYSTLCDQTDSWFESADYRQAASRTVNPTAIKAVETCLDQERIGLEVDTQRPDDELVVSLRYATPPGLAPQTISVTDYAWNKDLLECDGTLIKLGKKQRKKLLGQEDPDAVLDIVLGNEVRAVRCRRKGRLHPPVSCLDQELYHEGASLTIETTAGTIVRSLPAETPWRQDLTRRIAQLSQEKAHLQTTIDGTTARVDCVTPRAAELAAAGLQGCPDGRTEVYKAIPPGVGGVMHTRLVCCRAVVERPEAQ